MKNVIGKNLIKGNNLINILLFSLIFIFSTIFMFFSHRNDTRVPFEIFAYYYQNKETWEIKKATVDWEIWDWALYETISSHTRPNDVPTINRFNNWDLIGYKHFDEKQITNCRWVDIVTMSEQCIDKVSADYEIITLNDLTVIDVSMLYVLFLVYYWFMILGLILCDFFIIFIFYKILELLSIRGISLVFSLFIISAAIETIFFHLWISILQFDRTIYWLIAYFYLQIIKFPLFIVWSYLFYRKFIKWLPYKEFKVRRISFIIVLLFVFITQFSILILWLIS